MNASDQRNKSIISSKVGYLKDNTTLGSNINTGITEKNLIIMDEVDGMGGNDDKGGISALIEIIKITKIPIILICNDIYNQKLKSIINHCYDLRFSRPNKKSISKRLSEICKKEGFNVNAEILESLCESNGNDIRQCINFLEMRFKTGSKLSNSFCKDSILMINSFDAVKRLLNKNDSTKLNFKEKLDLFFIDFELIPIMIQV
jgi:replication factor C subunit 1